jgi:hypothetical protein
MVLRRKYTDVPVINFKAPVTEELPQSSKCSYEEATSVSVYMKVTSSILSEVLVFFFFRFTKSSTQPLTEMSTRNLPEDKGRQARKADNLTAICVPTV